MKATGNFEVKLQPLEPYAKDKEGLGRMSIDKTFTGDLEATSKGEMLSAMTSVEGSAGYVAIEKVEGTLNGKAGAFVLQHLATMGKHGQRQTIEVLPDSGTGELEGLMGTMEIIVEEGRHSYVFEFSLG